MPRADWKAVADILYEELSKHGFGDFHYTPEGWRDPEVLAALRVYTDALEFDGVKPSRCEQVGHDWRPKMDGPECLRCGARNDGDRP